jgi:hypothetical protein
MTASLLKAFYEANMSINIVESKLSMLYGSHFQRACLRKGKFYLFNI